MSNIQHNCGWEKLWLVKKGGKTTTHYARILQLETSDDEMSSQGLYELGNGKRVKARTLPNYPRPIIEGSDLSIPPVLPARRVVYRRRPGWFRPAVLFPLFVLMLSVAMLILAR